jgi:hypothetical protein
MKIPGPTGLPPRQIRRIFLIFCILPFVLLPILSLDAGISGDEPVHFEQAANVHNFFATHGRDSSAIETPITFLKFYGQSIDNFSFWINHTFGFRQPYLTRHIINATAGALTIAITGLLAAGIAGYGAGILAIILLLLSPVFLGHTYNNLKDIPFALGYVAAVYFLFRFIRKLPKISWADLAGLAAATGFANSVRIGGLVLFPIIVTFSLIQAWLKQPAERPDRVVFWSKLSAGLAAVLVLSYVAGLLDWPWALQSPFRNPAIALGRMTHYIVSIRQLFEGKLFWSENLPWYYAPKYFLLVTPAIVLAGIPLAWSLYKRLGPLPFLYLLFCAFFPLFWVVVVHANLYGNIRHLLFIYPLWIALSASGWIFVLDKLKKTVFHLGWYALLIAGLAGPFLHIAGNHPVEYVYFNRLSGGVGHAYHRYETDYYFNSLGPGVDWLKKEVLSKPGNDTLTVASNFPLEPFFEPDFPKIRTVFTTWFDRGKYDWDYGLFVNAYLGPSGLAGKQVPPEDIVHRVNVEGWPMCYVIQRNDRLDLQGYRLFMDGRYDEASAILRETLEKDPGNETAWLYLGWSLRKTGDLDGSNRAAVELIRIYPESERGRELLAWNYLDTRRFREAGQTVDELIRLNPKFPPIGILQQSVADSLARQPR